MEKMKICVRFENVPCMLGKRESRLDPFSQKRCGTRVKPPVDSAAVRYICIRQDPKSFQWIFSLKPFFLLALSLPPKPVSESPHTPSTPDGFQPSVNIFFALEMLSVALHSPNPRILFHIWVSTAAHNQFRIQTCTSCHPCNRVKLVQYSYSIPRLYCKLLASHVMLYENG